MLKQKSALGAYLDPIADKLLTSAAFISLVQIDLAPAWMVALIIGREFAVTALRSLAYARGIVIPSSPLGKGKMASQVTAILLLILVPVLAGQALPDAAKAQMGAWAASVGIVGLLAVFVLFSVLLAATRGLTFADPDNLETILRQTTIVALAVDGIPTRAVFAEVPAPRMSMPLALGVGLLIHGAALVFGIELVAVEMRLQRMHELDAGKFHVTPLAGTLHPTLARAAGRGPARSPGRRDGWKALASGLPGCGRR